MERTSPQPMANLEILEENFCILLADTIEYNGLKYLPSTFKNNLTGI